MTSECIPKFYCGIKSPPLLIFQCECETKWSIHSPYRFREFSFFFLFFSFRTPFLFFSVFFLFYYYTYGDKILLFHLLWVNFLYNIFYYYKLLLLLLLVIKYIIFEIKRLNLSESFLYNNLQELAINYWNSYTYSPSFRSCRLQFVVVYWFIHCCIC